MFGPRPDPTMTRNQQGLTTPGDAPGFGQAPVAMNQTVQKPGRSAWPKGAGPRTNDPERTMADIIVVATQEFSEKGLAGARIDVIAEALRASKRMICYYFGSKEGLYIRVLEEA
jgi:hypothetical protein